MVVGCEWGEVYGVVCELVGVVDVLLYGVVVGKLVGVVLIYVVVGFGEDECVGGVGVFGDDMF